MSATMSSFLTGTRTEEHLKNALLDASEYWHLAVPPRNILTLLSRCDQQDTQAFVIHTQASVTLKKKRVGR